MAEATLKKLHFQIIGNSGREYFNGDVHYPIYNGTMASLKTKIDGMISSGKANLVVGGEIQEDTLTALHGIIPTLKFATFFGAQYGKYKGDHLGALGLAEQIASEVNAQRQLHQMVTEINSTENRPFTVRVTYGTTMEEHTINQNKYTLYGEYSYSAMLNSKLPWFDVHGMVVNGWSPNNTEYGISKKKYEEKYSSDSVLITPGRMDAHFNGQFYVWCNDGLMSIILRNEEYPTFLKKYNYSCSIESPKAANRANEKLSSYLSSNSSNTTVKTTRPKYDSNDENQGGDGDKDDSSDEIKEDSLLSDSSLASGLVVALKVTESTLGTFASTFLRSSVLKKIATIFSDPLDYIVGLVMLPFSVQTSGSYTTDFYFSSDEQYFSEFTAPQIKNRFQDVNGGSVSFTEYWGSFMDYSPYTTISIYLPFIGVVPFSANDVMGHTVSLLYRVDVLTGALICFVKRDGSVFGIYQGNCATQVPMTSTDYSGMLSAIVSAGATALGIGATIATGGATAPALMATMGAINTGANVLSGGASATSERRGSLSAGIAMLTQRNAYAIIERPETEIPSSYTTNIGYPSNMTRSLGEVSGFTLISAIQLDGFMGTESEAKEIIDLVSKGVIL